MKYGFFLGQRVLIKDKQDGWYGITNAGKKATVCGFSRMENCIRILIDGMKCPQTYHRDFLEKYVQEN